MTATIDPTTTVATSTVAPATAVPAGTRTSTSRSLGDRIAATPLWRVAAVAGIAGAVAATLVAAVAEIAGVPMEAAETTAPAGEHIPLYGYAISVALATVVGALLAAVLHRKADRPARTFAIAAVVLTVASFGLPHTTGHATIATRLVLDLTHVVAAAVIIPAIVHRLARPRS